MKPVINNEDKAVSPIIATILLIAITVVLAATLVTILGGFTHGAANTTEAAGVTTTLNTNNNAITASVSSSSQKLSNSQVDFTLDVNGIIFSGNLAVPSVNNTNYQLNITHTTTSFTGGATFTFTVFNHTDNSYLSISTYSLNLNYDGTQFYSSGTQTS